MNSKVAGETAGAPLPDRSDQFGRSTAKIHWLAFADALHLRSVHEGIFFPKQPLPIIFTQVKSTPQAIDATLNGDATAKAQYEGADCGLCRGTQRTLQSKKW